MLEPSNGWRGAGRGDVADARRVLEAVIARGDAVPPLLLGAARHGLGSIFWRDADAISADAAEVALADSARMPPEEAKALLRRALAEFELAREQCVDAPNLGYARVTADAALVANELRDDEQTIRYASEALESLTPLSAPSGCAHLAAVLAGCFARLGRWDEAAEVYRTACGATEIAITVSSGPGRERAVEESSRLGRWAAIALSKTGDTVGAVLALETGRARELRRRLGPTRHERALLERLPQDVRDEYEAALAELVATPLGPASYEAAAAVERASSAVRAFDGLGDFGLGGSAFDMASGVEERWPVVYVNPTPNGTVLLSVDREGSPDEVAVRQSILQSPTSSEVWWRLASGHPTQAMAVAAGGDRLVSYLGAAANAAGGDARLRAAIDVTFPWVGEQIGRPLAELLRDRGARGVTLVLCGPIALVPVHACAWTTADGQACLLDEFEVRYAPSARGAGVAAERAADRDRSRQRLVALADPDASRRLPATVPEVQEIARHFAPRVTEIAVRTDATSAFLRRHAPGANVLHLAAHACAGLIDPEAASIGLADGAFGVSELASLPIRTAGWRSCRRVRAPCPSHTSSRTRQLLLPPLCSLQGRPARSRVCGPSTTARPRFS